MKRQSLESGERPKKVGIETGNFLEIKTAEGRKLRFESPERIGLQSRAPEDVKVNQAFDSQSAENFDERIADDVAMLQVESLDPAKSQVGASEVPEAVISALQNPGRRIAAWRGHPSHLVGVDVADEPFLAGRRAVAASTWLTPRLRICRRRQNQGHQGQQDELLRHLDNAQPADMVVALEMNKLQIRFGSSSSLAGDRTRSLFLALYEKTATIIAPIRSQT